MVYRLCQPSPYLKGFIRDYLLIDFNFSKTDPIPLKPYPACPKQGLIFYIRGSVLSSNPQTGTCEKRAQTVIFGQPLARQNLHLPKEYLAISVRFHPGALFKFLGIPLSEFVHKNVDAESVLGPQIRLLNEQLANTGSYRNMVALIEGFLWKKIQLINNNNHPVDKIAGLILANPQGFSLDEFASQACLSPSGLERRFVQQMGVTPKFYARICRFYKTFLTKQRNPGLSWVSIAWDSGYTDYQHLVKDFKEFSHCTPNQLIREDSHSPEQYLSLNPNFKYD
jgi:AraC-like DNA-binding protein